MKIERDLPDGRMAFTGYGPGYVDVNGTRHARSVLVSADAVTDWPVQSIEMLTSGDVEPLAAMRAEVVLIGTGATVRFPDPAVLAPLLRARIGVEVMDTQAACRTYNILLGEGRGVVAALIL
jgi:uncharacterized protein